MPAKHSELTDKLCRVKSRSAAAATILHNQKSVVGNCERPRKRARVTRLCKESFSTSSTAVLSALLAEPESYKNFCEGLTFENKCIPGLAAEVKELQRKLADRKKAKAASITAPKGRGRKRAAATDKRAATLKTELANAKALHSRLVEVATRSELDASKARAC